MNYMEEFKAIRVVYSKAFNELMNGTLHFAQVNSYFTHLRPMFPFLYPLKTSEN